MKADNDKGYEGFGLIVGWKNIVKSINYEFSESTLRRWVREYKMPILRTPSGRPMIFPGLIEMWLNIGNEVKEKHRDK